MPALRQNVEDTKSFIRVRVGNEYVYGGALSLNVKQGTDCSEIAQTVLEMVLGRWRQGRQSEGATTESYRYIDIGAVGPFGTIRVARWQDIPADAVVKLAFHHGPGGGAASHMWGEVDGMKFESRGGKVVNGGGLHVDKAKAISDPYAHAWAYLPGPILGAGVVDPADILARATGISYSRAQTLLPAVANGLIQSQANNPNRIAMWLAQVGHESDDFNATAEYASGDAYDTRTDLGNTPEVDGDGRLYKGRSWIQITGKHNFGLFSSWAHGKGLVPTPDYFVVRPLELSELKWAGIGAAWYWTVARPTINARSDARDVEAVTRLINGGTNGLSHRRDRFNRALSLGDSLLALINEQDEWEALMADNTLYPSPSPYRLDDKAVLTTRETMRQINGMVHANLIEQAALQGYVPAIADVAKLARGEGPGATDKWKVGQAQNIIRLIQANLAAQTGVTK
ncbi:hypothetical protein ASE48_08425 [Mycobacterium sp. Root265]|uniref:glycoside hydrolase family 19 protein n=1 Tax=Mycobacterium sp. Root265 TaxID=1736504 RepID=UPI0007098699|nr:hypothetical protein [Mycobacterium sp. Root265]KRD08582.1 hypothetical protein ASE48_08425 [Mycobacterium sp. Root265]